MGDPLAKKIGDKAANALRQQIKDIGEEVKEIPKSGANQVKGKDSYQETDQTDEDNQTQSGNQQLLTLLRGSGKAKVQSSSNSDDSNKKKAGQDKYLDREMQKARGERIQSERQKQEEEERENLIKQQQEQKKEFAPPSGRKSRGMRNPMDRKGKKKNELGRTAKG